VATRIALCTTCKGRAQHLKQTLPQNLADNADCANAVFVILDYGSDDDLLPYLREHHAADIASGRVVVCSFNHTGPFRMAHAKNMAHRLGVLQGADVLVNVDADNFTGPGFASYLLEKFTELGPDAFMWANMIRGVLPRGISGRIAVTAHAFLNAGGYDERFETWSPDDKDFNERLRRLGYVAHEIDVRFLDGVRHNDKIRFKDYPHMRTNLTEDQLQTTGDSETTIVNFGRFGCGEGLIHHGGLIDASCLYFRLAPVPTRVFGIGMHKTGTTSLHHALELMGLDSAHWQSAHWAKAIWMEMRTWGRSSTLERHYALSDLPITLLYQELDRAYPGSKFILTTRSEQAWLRSVERHWSREHNKFRQQWDTDPFTHRIHKELYGQKTFDRELFRARFRRHNDDVRCYFRDRPRDLLVMDIDHHGWPELCSFLHRPVPTVSYPRANGARA
jgi:hypothetical protein